LGGKKPRNKEPERGSVSGDLDRSKSPGGVRKGIKRNLGRGNQSEKLNPTGGFGIEDGIESVGKGWEGRKELLWREERGKKIFWGGKKGTTSLTIYLTIQTSCEKRESKKKKGGEIFKKGVYRENRVG